MTDQQPRAVRPLRIIFAGTPDFAAVALAGLLDSAHEVVAVYTQPDRPAGRGRKLKPGPVKQLALDHHILVAQFLSLKDGDEQEKLAAWQADIMVVAAYGLLLPEAVLAIPPLGCLNIHASLLPRWRGAAPIQRAILAGDTETGITIMQMDKGLDTGEMLLKEICPISPEDTAESLHDKLAELGKTAILTALADPAGLKPEQQDDDSANYAKKLDKAEALIDWTRPAAEIARLVRAFNPWPVAQTGLGGKILRIWQAVPLDNTPGKPAGTLTAAAKAGIDVACGSGSLRILTAQLPGGKPLPVADLLNGHADLFQVGTRLT